MTLIKSAHDLLEDADQPNDAARMDGQWARYGYLFRDLADQPDAGRFSGTDDTATIDRLKAFELAFRKATDEDPQPPLMLQLPAAYTYFGQFMNHDISAPITGPGADVGATGPVGIIGSADPPGLRDGFRADVATILDRFVNQHAAPLTLASLYGTGLQIGPPAPTDLYEADGRRFRLGKTARVDDQVFLDQKIPPRSVKHDCDAPDIPRAEKTPLIADRRNDDNLILSQLHLAFMLFHNRMVAALEDLDDPPEDIFATARQGVTLHYHWLILHDYLPNLLSPTIVARPLADWQRRSPEPDTVPMEFTSAAFRFGHSMVGRAYDFNANFGRGGNISKDGATLEDLFNFTSKFNMNDPGGPLASLPDHWVIDWDRMTRLPEPVDGNLSAPGGAEQIDLHFAPRMLDSAGNATVALHGSILYRNLLRGFHRRMPFGQILAEACGIDRLTRDQIAAALRQDKSPNGAGEELVAAAEQLGFLEETPAWLYLLCEAKILEGGARVGPTASQIIADTIVCLMRNNAASVLRYREGAWHPRDSILQDIDDQPLDSLRRFLVFAARRTEEC